MLHEGEVLEDGAPDRLMRHNGPYGQTVRRELDRLTSSAAVPAE